MKRVVISSLIVACLGLACSAESASLQLSLNEAIRLAAEKNLDVRAEFYNPAQLEAEIQRNRSIYDPQLSLDASYADSTSPAISPAIGSSGQSADLNASLSQLLWTGGTAAAIFRNNYTSTDSFAATEPEYWQTRLGVSLSQPLLKNVGRESTEIAITTSRLSKFASIEHLKTRLLTTVSQVRQEYYKLYAYQEQLVVRTLSLELARTILKETKARVAAGVLPAMEILNAEFGVVSREKEVIDAEKLLRDQQDVLRVLLQLHTPDEIIASDTPGRESSLVSEEDAVRQALARPDIRELKRSLEIAELQTRVFGTNIRPDLRLTAQAGIAGKDKSFGRGLEKLGTVDSPYWSFGLSLSYPLGNRAAENDYRKSRLKTEQIALQIKNLEDSAAKDAKVSRRGVASGYKQIEVAERGRAYAEERLKAFIRKNEVGLATTKDVLDVENDLANARNNLIAAIVGYNNALTQFWQTTGELLEREGIRVVESDVDRLYTAIP